MSHYATEVCKCPIMGLLPEPWSKLVFSLGYFALCWFLLYFLYKKNCFLKVSG